MYIYLGNFFLIQLIITFLKKDVNRENEDFYKKVHFSLRKAGNE